MGNQTFVDRVVHTEFDNVIPGYPMDRFHRYQLVVRQAESEHVHLLVLQLQRVQVLGYPLQNSSRGLHQQALGVKGTEMHFGELCYWSWTLLQHLQFVVRLRFYPLLLVCAFALALHAACDCLCICVGIGARVGC